MVPHDEVTPASEPPSATYGDTDARPPNALDVQLVGAVLRRDVSALDRFSVRLGCVARFVASCNMQIGSVLGREELEDVAQNTIVTVWSKLAAYRGEASLETWVFRFCDYEVRNASRRVARRRALSLELVGEPNSAPEAATAEVDALDEAERLEQEIQQLPPDESTVLRLKHYESLTFDAIGTKLGLSANTVKTRYYRALAGLRRSLQKTNEP